MMDYHEMGWSGGWWIVMWVMMATFWIVAIAVAAWLVVALRRDVSPRHERPEDTLARRLAAGEIDEATYRRLYDAIHPRPTPLAPSG